MPNTTTNNLPTILTSSLLLFILKNRIPFLANPSPLNFQRVNALFCGEVDPSLNTALHNTTFPVLQHLSKIPLTHLLSQHLLLTCLPPPSSPNFPPQALGLLLLLDQAPRTLCKGMNVRWCNSFFDLVVINLATEFWEMEEGLRPWGRGRWIGELSYGFDHWVITSIWFTVPFTHSESLPDHDISHFQISALKSEMELFLSKIGQDPYSGTEDIWNHDVYTFPREAKIGGPVVEGNKIKMQDFVWWVRMLLDSHRCIVEIFGRYPFRNGGNGRISSKEEEGYLVEIGGFGGTGDEEANKRVREDVLDGRWSSLE